MKIRFTENDHTILFYQKENDAKYSFEIEGEEELTQWLLSNVKTKRIREKDLRYAKEGIFKKIKEYPGVADALTLTTNKSTEKSPVSRLNEFCLARYKRPMKCRSLGVDTNSGLFHVQIELPNGAIYEDYNINKRMAKNFAALIACFEEFHWGAIRTIE